MDIRHLVTTIFNENIELLITFIPHVLLAIISLITIIYLGKIVNKVIAQLLQKSQFHKLYGNLTMKTLKIVYIFFAIIVCLNILGFKNLSTGLFASGGVVTIILGFALREIGENFCAGLLLSINKPFQIGDTVKSLDVEGCVKSIEIRYTHIRSLDGKDIYVPSSQIYKNTLINYTKDGLRRYDCTIGIDYSSNLKKACAIIDHELQLVEGILHDPLPNCFVQDLRPGYIEIIIYFWMNVDADFSLKQVKEELISRVKDKLIDEGFILSHNTSSNYDVTLHYKDKIKPSC